MSNDRLVLRGARVVDPANDVDGVLDVCVDRGRIVADPPADAQIIDVSGLVLCPGFIDLHVHLREPGQTHKEDIRSGTRAAAAGGFTTVIAMPNTSPPVDTPERLREVRERIAANAVVHVLQTACLTLERQGEALADAQALADAEAVALTDDGGCVPTAGLMLEAVQAAKRAGLVVIDHCEDETVSRGRPMNRGAAAMRLGLAGQMPLAEELMVARDALIAAEVQWPLHIQHISAARSVEIVRYARSRGVPLTAEATPHHFCLTDESCETHGTQAKMNPPLRSEHDRQALLRGLADGTIQAIATDHAPHTAAEKATSMDEAPFGIVGLEAAVTLALDRLVHGGVLSLARLVALFTAGPRSILGLDAGTLTPGSAADITILNVDAANTIRTEDFFSKSRNCPYDGMTCRGRVEATMVDGRFVHNRLADA